MNNNTKIWKTILPIAVILILLGSTVIPSVLSDNGKDYGFEKGITWQPFETIKKATLVQFDKETLVDDYAYLASIPGSVFSDGNTLYTSPLLLFQGENTYPDEEKYRFLDDYESIKYLMDDWMSYCDGQLDKLTIINVDKSDLDASWKSRGTTAIEGDDPYQLASDIALSEWSYSNDAVVAVIEEEFEKAEDAITSGSVSGEVSGEVGKDSLKIKRSYGPSSEYESFTVEEEYKYVEVDLWYPCFMILPRLINMVPGFGGAPGITMPSVDPDLQIACKYEYDWLQTAASSDMTITHGPHEECFSYVYKPGDWRVSVTNMPTEGGIDDEDFINNGLLGFGSVKTVGSFKDALKNLISGVTDFNVDITKYPGVEVEIPDMPEFGCGNAVFELTWDNDNVDLGLTIVGPSGEEIESVMTDGEDKNIKEINLHKIGECLEGEHYKAVVYALDDISGSVDFTVDYSWEQNITKTEGDMIASACEGAVLGSITNSPLLYTKPDDLSECTADALYKLGAEEIYIVDLSGCLTEEVENQLSKVGEIKEHYMEYKDIYQDIMDYTSSNDVVFSTVDPWSYWYYGNSKEDLKPDGEFEGAFYFAPAAYAAAHHGTPLLLVDNHPELSGAVTWHGDFWRKNARGVPLPSIANMFFTGSKVYNFLDEYGFDQEGAESILTVAGQYDIGPTWTRVFAGVANSGAIIGTPVDASSHIARCIFYPGLIFQNPALNGNVELETGSESKRLFRSLTTPLQGGILSRIWPGKTEGLTNLVITNPSRIEEFEYPVLHTYGCYTHRFNERGSEYWGTVYQTRTGHIPGVDISSEEIDQGVREMTEGISGSFLPDLSHTEVAPFYAEKAGYGNVYSTNFDITMNNLNQGVISWYMVYHGDSAQGGWISWWQPLSETLSSVGVPSALANAISKIAGVPLGMNPEEENPWRAYDILWGSTEEPDSAILNSEIGILPGWLNYLTPFRDSLNRGVLKLGLDFVPSRTSGYYDGLVGPYSLTAMFLKFAYSHAATEVDDKLENLHSMDFHAGSCLIGCNYFQITLMRHGSVLQECDPWGTSYWSGYAGEQVPRDYALGKTAGETYAEGITEIGVKYLFEDDEDRVWWWDTAENMVLFTDPDLRIWVPSTDYDDRARNHWEREDILPIRYDNTLSVDGHMPFGATEYPKEREPLTILQEYLWLIISTIVIIILIVALVVLSRKKK